jgi:hypothetical protein
VLINKKRIQPQKRKVKMYWREKKSSIKITTCSNEDEDEMGASSMGEAALEILTTLGTD